MLLSPIQARALFQDALKHQYAILAVNADSPSAILDCLEAARLASAPIIIETSLWQLKGRSFGAGDPVLGLARYLADLAVLANSPLYHSVPVVFHTDHIKGPETIAILTAAIKGVSIYGYGGSLLLRASTISVDSSELTEEQNIALLRQLASIADADGTPAVFEMEAGVDDGLTPLETTRNLLGSVEATHPGKITLWAPGVGTRHGFSADGFPAFSAGHVAAQAKLAKELTGRPIGIALHGSSGLPEEHLLAAVQAGVAKVNWSSESLLIRSAAAKDYYFANAPKLDKLHKEFKNTAMDNGLQSFISTKYIPIVTDRIKLLGGENKSPSFITSLSIP